MDISGHLYVVATPIGNIRDITLRALEVLKNSDLIVCEDTRVTGNLLHHYEIKKPMRALNEFNEQNLVYEIIKKLEEGEVISLVSDNGTPLISDPGFLLVREARKRNILVTPIPGPSAVTAALSASGLPTDSFIFLGFLPKNNSKKINLLTHLRDTVNKNYSPTIVMYESPHRLTETLKVMLEIFGDKEVTVAREITKLYEEFRTESVSVLIDSYTQNAPKGEITLLISLK